MLQEQCVLNKILVSRRCHRLALPLSDMAMYEDDDLEKLLATVSRMFPAQWKDGYARRLKDNRLISPHWDEIPADLDLDDPEQLAWWNGYYTAKLATHSGNYAKR
jgi:hypothetical protein